MSDAGMRCPHVTGGCTQYCEAANRFARERDDARQALREYEHHVMVGRDEQHHRLVLERDDARATLDKWLEEKACLQAEVERLRASLSKCLLSDPPGDCYAAECVDLRAERDAIQKAFDARADEFAEMRRESWLMGVRLREARDEVERLRDSLSVTGDTRHEAMEAAIRVAQAHSETIRQLRAEVERLRAVIAEAGHLAHRCVQLTRERDDARRLVEMMRDDPGAIVPVPLPWEGE